MLESTNALIGALIAVLRELRRCQECIENGRLSEDEEEEMGLFINQLHEALADISECYESRREPHSSLLPYEQLVERIAKEAKV